MPTPITWRNVRINTGAGAAAFGNVAANLGRSGQQGLSDFSEAMDRRVTREDELRLNEAISAARSGGPQVSSDRRVDASALQEAVQSKLTSDEAKETSDLTQLGKGFSNTIEAAKAKNIDNTIKLEADLAGAQIRNQDAQAGKNKAQQSKAEYEVQVAKREWQESVKFKADAAAVDEYMTVGLPNELRTKFMAKLDGDERAIGWSPEQKEQKFQEQLPGLRAEVESDPNFGRKWAMKNRKMGATAYNKTVWGQEEDRVRVKLEDEIVTRLVAQKGKDKVYNTAVDGAAAGDRTSVVFDPGTNSLGFAKSSGTINDATMKTYLNEVPGININDPDDLKDMKPVMDAMKTAFPNPSAFQFVAKSLSDEDGDYIGNEAALSMIKDRREDTIRQAQLFVKKRNEAPIGSTPDTAYESMFASTVIEAAEGEGDTDDKSTTEGYTLPKSSSASENVQAIRDVLNNAAVTLDNLTPRTQDKAEDWIYLARQMQQRVDDPQSSYSSKKAASKRLAKAMKAIEAEEKKSRAKVDTQELEAEMRALLKQ